MSSAPHRAGDGSPPVEAASGLEVRLFGSMEVCAGGRPLPRLRSRKGRWLLALLALRAGRDVDRGWLAGTLWPECAEADGRRSLRQSLHNLRLALGPEAHRLACLAPRTLRLDVAVASVDVLAFDMAVARCDGDSLEAAVHLYRGRLLEDCAEEWCLEERRPREEAYLAALKALAAAATTRREHPAAASFLRLAAGADPFREDLQRALMESLARSGSPAAALAVYREYRALLWREMAAEPSDETTGLFRQVRDDTRGRARPSGPGSPAAPAQRSGLEQRDPKTARPRLPTPLTELIGRDEEVRELIARTSHARLVTLSGTGGIGKTRLALRVAEELAGDFVDGVWLVELAALSDPGLVPQAVAAALAIQEDLGKSLAQTVVDAMRPRQLLLLLDNCEHLLAASAALAEALLSQCAGVRILATSRQSLGVRGESVWRVPSLAVPANGRLETINQSPAVQLFVERARAADASFEMTPRTARAVVEVCRRLDGIPLAIELAAARVRVMAVEQIAQRLNDRFRLLAGGSRTALPRHQTLRAAMDWSYELLSEAERLLMRRLSVFAGGWTLEAAEDVCGSEADGVLEYRSGCPRSGRRVTVTPDCPNSNTPTLQHSSAPILHPANVLDLLTSLVDRSLVGVERREEAARYVLLETTREYAREHLRAVGDDEALRARHAQFFVALAQRAEPELHGPAQAEWLRRLEEDHENFRAAIDFALSQGAVEDGLRLGGALGPFWWMRGYFSEGRERLQAFLALSGYDFESTEPGAAGWRVGEVARWRAPGPRAPQPSDRWRAGDPGGGVPACGSRDPGEVARWRVVNQDALAPTHPPTNPPTHQLTNSPDFRQAQAKALYYTGMLADDQGDYDAAGALFQESLALSRELGDQTGAAKALNGLGALARHAGDCKAARALYGEGLAIWRKLGEPWWTATSLTNLARVALLEGEEERACELVESALEIQKKLQDQRAIARSLVLLGSLAARLGDDERAQALHAESLAIVRELGASMPIEETLQALGHVAHERGDYEAARAFHEERLTIAREMGSAWGIAESLYYLGLLASDRGGGSRAGALWSECLALSQRLGDSHRIAECLEGLASLALPPAQPGPVQTDPEDGVSHFIREAPGGTQRAARLYGAADALREAGALQGSGAPADSRHRADDERHLAATLAIKEDAAFAAAWAEGRAMPLEQAIAEALRGG